MDRITALRPCKGVTCVSPSRVARDLMVMLLAAVFAAPPARADPATLVTDGFSWRVQGQTDAEASVSCVQPPPPQDPCVPIQSCSPNPTQSFDVTGSTMEVLNEAYSAAFNCGAVCNCCVQGASGHGGAQAEALINPSTSPWLTSWTVGGFPASSAAAAGPQQPDCTSGSGTASGFARQDWTLIFDTDATITQLTLDRQHQLAVIDQGQMTTSTITLDGPSGPESVSWFAETITRSTEGATNADGGSEFLLPPGRYTLTIASQTDSAAASGGGVNGGSSQARAICTLQLRPYCQNCPGNMNADGRVDGRDIQGWVDCLLAGGVGAGGACPCGNMNADQALTLDDLSAFVDILLNESGPPCL